MKGYSLVIKNVLDAGPYIQTSTRVARNGIPDAGV